jgi:hypothetical protein
LQTLPSGPIINLMISISRHSPLKTLVAPHRDRRVVIEARDDGHYQFVQERFYGDPTQDDDHVGWQPIGCSGVYESADAAESEARIECAWLS